VPALPWKRLAETDPDREYVVVATYIPVRHVVKLPEFWSNVRKIVKQLNSSDGLVGYSLLARPFRSDYWTLSAWESDEAVRRFAETEPHRSIAPRITSFSEVGFDLAKWTAVGRDLPPRWDKAVGLKLKGPDADNASRRG